MDRRRSSATKEVSEACGGRCGRRTLPQWPSSLRQTVDYQPVADYQPVVVVHVLVGGLEEWSVGRHPASGWRRAAQELQGPQRHCRRRAEEADQKKGPGRSQ